MVQVCIELNLNENSLVWFDLVMSPRITASIWAIYEDIYMKQSDDLMLFLPIYLYIYVEDILILLSCSRG